MPMSLGYAHVETYAPTSTKLGVGHQSCRSFSPSTSEGSSEGHLCPAAPRVSANGPASLDGGSEEVKKVMGRYAMGMTKDSFMGAGSFSTCRKGTDLMTGEAVAIKAYKVQQGENENSSAGTLTKFKKQVAVLQHLLQETPQSTSSELGGKEPCKFFVRLIDYSKDASGAPGPDPFDGLLYVVTELAEQSLKEYLRAQRGQRQLLSCEAVRRLARSVVMAAAALHEKGYVHLDLKPENMMIFNGRLKIIDVDGCVKIGSVIALRDSSSSFSPCYCAPEWARFMQGGAESQIVAQPSLDAWAVGLILCECATLSPAMRPAFSHFLKSSNSPMEANLAFIDWLANLETSPVPQRLENFGAGLGECLSRGLLVCDPDQRLTPAQCLSSQYLCAP